MNKRKVLIIVLIALLILLMLLLGYRLNKKDDLSKVVIYDPIIAPVLEEMENEKGKIQDLSDRIELYNVKRCLGNFYMQCAYLKSEYFDGSDNTTLKTIYSMLSNEYKEFDDITLENITNKVEIIEDPVIEIYEVYSLTNFDNVYNYIVHGGIRNFKTNELKEFNNIVSFDRSENTFEIYLDKYVKNIVDDINNIKIGDEINFVIKDEIADRAFNHYTQSTAKTEEFLRDYTQMIKNLMIYNPELAYKKIDENSNIKSLDELNDFVSANKNDLYSLSYGTHEIVSINDNKVGYKVYDNNKKYCLSIYFENYTTFSFDIEKF